MTVLLIADAERKRIAEVVTAAEAYPILRSDLQRLANGFDPSDRRTAKLSPSSHPRFNLKLGDYWVTYTHEDQPMGLCRHLSVSIPAPGRLPLPAAVEMIMEEFSFLPKETRKSVMWLEDVGDRINALNILQVIVDDSIERN